MPVPQNQTARPWNPTAVLGFLAAGLLAAVALLPAAVAERTAGSDGVTVASLPRQVSDGFDRWFASGLAEPDPGLAAATRFWAVFHGVKAGCAVLLLVALVLLLRRVWTAWVAAGSRAQGVPLALAGVGGAVLAAVALLVVLANVQGTVAPLSSVLSFLPVAPPTSTMTAVHAQLAAGESTPFLSALVGDFRLYHAAFVVCASVAVVGLVGAACWLWLRRARAPRDARRLRRLLAAGGVSLGLTALLLGVVVLANLSTVADTAPALAAFLGGGR